MKKLFLAYLICITSCYSQNIALQSIASGFSLPVELVSAGDSRLFVVQQRGLIRILNPNTGAINATPFMDLTTVVNQSGSERGLLGLAFHPNYATNGTFYVSYTRTSDGANVIDRCTVSANPDLANTARTQIITVSQPQSNHNGGCIRFGPDGFLYIGIGDGGGAGDTSNNAQNINTNLGKMLRINVDGATTYTIPSGNPFAGATAGNDEIWAYGLRNPWKFSFDNNDLWIADVGQNEWEEVNKVSSTSAGLNYGWRCKEANTDYNTSVGCTNPASFTVPVAAINHSTTGYCSVTGGYVYRGTEFPNLVGKYIFGDFCDSKIGIITSTGMLSYTTTGTTVSVSSFGIDNLKRMYLVDYGGTIYKITDTLSSDSFSNDNFSVYPNPNKGSFTVELTNIENANLEVYTIAGRLVYEKESISSETVNINNLETGVYLVKITSEGKNSVRKVIVE